MLDGEVQGRSGLTPFAWWAATFGLWPLVLAAAVLILVMRTLKASRRYRR